MHYYKAFGLHILSEIELPELSEGSAGEPVDLRISLGEITAPAFRKTHIYRRGIRAGFSNDAAENLYLHWEGVATYEAQNGNTLVVSPATEDPNLLSLFTVSEALGLILFQRGFLLLHASAIQVGTEAWCFTGAPGAGKSTTAAAFIKEGCQLLSDDLTAISFDENGAPVVIPAYPQIKIWNKTVNGLDYDMDELAPVSEGVDKFAFQPRASFSHDKIPLSKIFFLHKSKNKPKMQLLKAHEISAEALRNFPLPLALLKGEAMKTHFSQVFSCIRFVEICRKRRPEGFENLQSWISESIESVNA